MKSPQIVNYYGDSKLLRRSIFSTAGSFGFACFCERLRLERPRLGTADGKPREPRDAILENDPLVEATPFRHFESI